MNRPRIIVKVTENSLKNLNTGCTFLSIYSKADDPANSTKEHNLLHLDRYLDQFNNYLNTSELRSVDLSRPSGIMCEEVMIGLNFFKAFADNKTNLLRYTPDMAQNLATNNAGNLVNGD